MQLKWKEKDFIGKFFVINREQLKEQQRLNTQRKILEKQKEREEDNKLLAMSSEIVQAKKREQLMEISRRAKQDIEEFSMLKGRKKRIQHYVDSNPYNVYKYELSQKNDIEIEKQKVEQELDRTAATQLNKPIPIEIPKTMQEIDLEQPIINNSLKYRFHRLEIPNHKDRRYYNHK